MARFVAGLAIIAAGQGFDLSYLNNENVDHRASDGTDKYPTFFSH
ncbi:MAG: hypothetical protein R3F20_05735 [Planctomycetota bacterium]